MLEIFQDFAVAGAHLETSFEMLEYPVECGRLKNYRFPLYIPEKELRIEDFQI